MSTLSVPPVLTSPCQDCIRAIGDRNTGIWDEVSLSVTGVASDVKEVLDTFQVAAELGSDSLGDYVISMAYSASDVLAVELLQKDARLSVSEELGRPCPGRLRCDKEVWKRSLDVWYSSSLSFGVAERNYARGHWMGSKSATHGYGEGA